MGARLRHPATTLTSRCALDTTSLVLPRTRYASQTTELLSILTMFLPRHGWKTVSASADGAKKSVTESRLQQAGYSVIKTRFTPI